MNQRSDATPDELKLLYQITVNDLSYFKAQQWSVTNYSFLLLAGIVGAWQVSKANIALWELGALVALAVAICVSSLIILKKLQDSIVVRQSRLDAAREHFSVAFYKAWAAETKPNELIHSITLLRGAVAMGTIAVCWLLLRDA